MPKRLLRPLLAAPLSLAIATTAIAQMAAPYGTATPGTGGVAPRIWISGEPYLGATFAVTLDSAVGGGVAGLWLSGGAADLSVLQTRVLIDPNAMLLATAGKRTTGANGAAGQGEASWQLTVPNVASLAGASVFGQSIIIDAGGGTAGLAATDGLRFTTRQSPALVGLLSSFGGSGGLETIPLNGGAPGLLPMSVGNWSNLGISADGRVALVWASFNLAAPVHVVDVSTTPATAIAPVPLPAGVNRTVAYVALHPTAPRGYLVVDRSNGSGNYGELWNVDLDPNSATFAQPLRQITVLDSHYGPPSLSADGRRLAVAHSNGLIRWFSIVDVEPGSPTRDQVIGTSRSTFAPLGAIALSPKGDHLFTAGPGNSIERIDTTTYQVDAVSPLGAGCQHIEVDPRGRHVVAQFSTRFVNANQIDIVDVQPGSFGARRTITFAAPVNAIALSPDGEQLVVGSARTYTFWDVATATQVGAPIATSSDIAALEIR